MDLPTPLKRAARALGIHRITTCASAQHVRVELAGEVLAESGRAIELRETGAPLRFYLPWEDVRTDLLTRSETTSRCPFKGEATYWSAPGAQDAFWSYEAPSEPEVEPIAGLLSPWPGRVEVGPRPRPIATDHVPAPKGTRPACHWAPLEHAASPTPPSPGGGGMRDRARERLRLRTGASTGQGQDPEQRAGTLIGCSSGASIDTSSLTTRDTRRSRLTLCVDEVCRRVSTGGDRVGSALPAQSDPGPVRVRLVLSRVRVFPSAVGR